MTKKTLTPTARLVAPRIEDLAPEKSQAELAKKMGFDRPNMLSMIRNGAAAVPFAKIPIIAQVLGIDAAQLLRSALKDQWPGPGKVVDEVLGGILSPAEREWLKLFSEVHLDWPPSDPLDRKLCKEIMRDFAKRAK